MESMNLQSSAIQAWSRVCAFAWKHQEKEKKEGVLTDLRKDPKGTIEEIAKGQNGKYKADSETEAQASTIIKLSKNQTERYSGYLPIPNPFGGLAELDPQKVEELLLGGLTGAFKFDEEAKLWADALHQAWNNKELLENIRRDPLGNLPHADELKNSEYGIFPLPALPSVVYQNLENLDIEQLYEFLVDDNVRHIGGIMPPVT
ncbi:hypothetical protein IQ264_05340 [Phormidium sp. LEGE 05292]|uniref:hypothetical protein n=1 Tax=[Phormidium] sp. LEGE 05292 TaxID=767427 RepID=UPI00187F5E44|nr:hypothetical protein [Phormidium sp. LEGE 05292]MBE9224889.1 hypothetical protein [Phormidium sp. LEGE 05292]